MNLALSVSILHHSYLFRCYVMTVPPLSYHFTTSPAQFTTIAIARNYAPLERPPPLEKTTSWGRMLTKTEQV